MDGYPSESETVITREGNFFFALPNAQTEFVWYRCRINTSKKASHTLCTEDTYRDLRQIPWTRFETPSNQTVFILLRCGIEGRKSNSHTHSTEGSNRNERPISWTKLTIFLCNNQCPNWVHITPMSNRNKSSRPIPLRTLTIATCDQFLGRESLFSLPPPNANFECIQLRCRIKTEKWSCQTHSTDGKNRQVRQISWTRLTISICTTLCLNWIDMVPMSNRIKKTQLSNPFHWRQELQHATRTEVKLFLSQC